MNDANAFRNSSFPRGPTTGATNLKSLANSAGSSAPLFLARMRLVLAMRVSGETGNVEDASMAASSTICSAQKVALGIGPGRGGGLGDLVGLVGVGDRGEAEGEPGRRFAEVPSGRRRWSRGEARGRGDHARGDGRGGDREDGGHARERQDEGAAIGEARP